MDSFFTFAWFWKALRGRSVTFAALFALTVTGFSVLAWMRGGLRAAGAPWLVLLLVPAILLMFLAKKESQWIPDDDVRSRWARGLIFGSLIAAILSAWLAPQPAESDAPLEPVPVHERMRGPRGK